MHWEMHPLGPWNFPQAGILYPSASWCKIPALGKSLGPRGRPLSVPFLLRTSGISQSSWLDYLGGCISQYPNPSSQECTDTLHPFSWQCIVYKTIQGLILGCLGIRHIVSSIQYRSPSLWCVWPQPWHRLWNVIWATLNRKRLNGAFSSRSTRVLT